MFLAKFYQYLYMLYILPVPSISKCSTSTFKSKHKLKPFLSAKRRPAAGVSTVSPRRGASQRLPLKLPTHDD